jgi:hypothetical protein
MMTQRGRRPPGKPTSIRRRRHRRPLAIAVRSGVLPCSNREGTENGDEDQEIDIQVKNRVRWLIHASCGQRCSTPVCASAGEQTDGLTLGNRVRFELCKHPEQVEEAFAATVLPHDV